MTLSLFDQPRPSTIASRKYATFIDGTQAVNREEIAWMVAVTLAVEPYSGVAVYFPFKDDAREVLLVERSTDTEALFVYGPEVAPVIVGKAPQKLMEACSVVLALKGTDVWRRYTTLFLTTGEE
jgi:hypothetical protein